jgi:uncharacterized protein
VSGTDLGAFADDLMGALDEGDHATVESCFSPDATWWLNGRLRGRFAEVLPELKRAKPQPTPRRHEQIRRLFAPQGFTDQHITRLRSNGGDVELAVCVVVRVEDGRVSRFEEYFDASQLPR